MKVAFFVHCFFPNHFYGTETYTLDLARHYQRLGHDVVVISALFQGEPAADAIVTQYEYAGVPVICIDKNHLPHTRVKETYYQTDMRPVLEKLLQQVKPDIVHVTHLINHTSALLEVTQNLGIPTYATFTDFFGFCLNNKLEDAAGNLCAGPQKNRNNCVACYLSETSKGADRWAKLCTTPARAKLIAKTANIARRFPPLRGTAMDGLIEDIARRPDTLLSLYNNAYTAAVAPTQFLRQAYERNGFNMSMHNIWFGIDIDRSPKPERGKQQIPVIGFIGQIAPHKGTDILIEAFTRLPKGSAELRIYGPEDQDAAYMAKLRCLADGHLVRFMGTFPRENMSNILSDIDLFVIPSRWYENSPLVLLNALATHTPVLVSDVLGMTEFLQPGINGFSFERGNVDSLENQIRQLLEDKGRLQALSKTTKYEITTSSMAEQTFSIYK